jgi:menaquinone-dependent protoporphyrinogen IX oxidase
MKTAIFYRSFLGNSRNYALWLGKYLKTAVLGFNDFNNKTIKKYHTVVVISGTYAGWMPLTGFLQKHWEILKNKKVIVVSVGISPANVPYTKKTFQKIPPEILKKVKHFRIPGNMFGIKPLGDVEKENLKEVVKYLKK